MGDSNIRTIATTALVTASLTTLCFQLYHHYKAKNNHEAQIQKKLNTQKYDEELIQEQLARNYVFLGDEGMKKVRGLHVTIVGAGGVGSWVATMLIRSGVEHVTIIDFDQVTLSSLNRHSVANLSDVGISKVDTLKKHLSKIAPWCEINAINSLWTIEKAEELTPYKEFNKENYYIIDCIDNIDTKVDLLTYCYEHDLKIIASGGAACKSDPTRINIGDISITEEDPMIKSVRRRLKKKGINNGITVVFSAEKPDPRKANLLPLPDEEFAKGKVDQLSSLQNFRVRILPVLGPMPGMFGLVIVSHLITLVAGYPIEVVEGKNRMKLHDGVFNSLTKQQPKLGLSQVVPLSVSDVGYILEEVFKGKSPISGYSTRLTLSKWDPSKELSTQNAVIMTKEEQRIHEDRILLGGEKFEDVYSKEVLERIEKKFAEERWYSQFR